MRVQLFVRLIRSEVVSQTTRARPDLDVAGFTDMRA